jgi:heme-degrading monooxygenase HmoA
VIVRCWRGRLKADDAPRYRAHFVGDVVPALRSIPGFRSVRLLQRPHPTGVEVLVMTCWASWEAVRTFAGEPCDVAVVEPAARALLVDYDTHVEHFEEIEAS